MRAAFVIGLVALGLGIGVAPSLVSRALHTFHSLTVPTATAPGAPASPDRIAPHPKQHESRILGSRHPSASRARAKQNTSRPRGARSTSALVLAAIAILACLAVLLAGSCLLVGRRTLRRRRRVYGLYRLHLSTHDQAKPQDLEDMVEAVANVIRAWPSDRMCNGQPYVALELIWGPARRPDGGIEMEWSINIRSEPRIVTALDGAISAAYPDVRLGRLHGEEPRPRKEVLVEPRHLMRFRKERSFVYSLIADGEQQASSPIEQIARTQVALGEPSVVRFQLTPTPSRFEELARRLYRRHENRLVRHERIGVPDGGLLSTFNRAEMHAAERTQNRSLFWLETVVAADSAEVCKSVAGAVQSRRGENRLHRRWMVVRQRLYRKRFPLGLGPLVPSFRSLVSAAEVAHLLALPSARMKGVPVRRVTIPRIPAPPEIVRGGHPRATAPTARHARQSPRIARGVSSANGAGAV